MQRIWWCSFADELGPLGVVVTPDEECGDVVLLAARLHHQGINPGGDLLAGYAPEEAYSETDTGWALEPGNQNRLIGVKELRERKVDSVILEGDDDE